MKRRKDGRLQTQIMINVNGVDKPKYFYGKSEAEIKRKMVEFKTEIEKGELFGVVAEQWRDDHFSKVAHKTTECYNAPYNRIYEQFKDKYILQITPQQISLFISQVSKQGYSLRTVRAYIAVFNMIFKFAILNGYITINPAEFVQPPNGLKTTRRELPSEADIERIKMSLEKSFGLFAYFILYTGCRRGEALALKYEDIDYDKKIIHINKSIYFDNNKPVVKSTKTEAGTREVILLDQLCNKLDKAGTGYIFHTNGQPITLSAFQKRWAKYKKESGVTITPHQIRHAYATILYEAGIDERMAQELLGHANITTTLNIYTHIRKSKKEATADILNAYLK